MRGRLWPSIITLAFMGVVAAQSSPVETAWNLIAKGERAKAVQVLRDAIQKDPRNGDARLLLGSVLMEQGQETESLEQLKEAVRLKPRSSEAHNALGEAYKTFGHSKEALPEFEKAVEIDSRFAQAQINLAAALLEQENPAGAAPHLDRALALLGNAEEAAYPLYLRAKVYMDSRDAAKAVAVLEKAVKLRADFAEAWSDLGEARRSLTDDRGAIEALQRAVELSPDDAVAQTRCGTKLLEMGNAHEAVAHLEAAVRVDPKNQSALNSLQSALRKDGQTAAADAVRRKLAEVIRERDRNDQALVMAIEINNRGASLEKSGDVRGAIEKYRSALDLQPDHAGIRANLATALIKTGQWEEGIAQLREAVRRDPRNAVLKSALDEAVEHARSRSMPVAKP